MIQIVIGICIRCSIRLRL